MYNESIIIGGVIYLAIGLIIGIVLIIQLQNKKTNSMFADLVKVMLKDEPITFRLKILIGSMLLWLPSVLEKLEKKIEFQFLRKHNPIHVPKQGEHMRPTDPNRLPDIYGKISGILRIFKSQYESNEFPLTPEIDKIKAIETTIELIEDYINKVKDDLNYSSLVEYQDRLKSVK